MVRKIGIVLLISFAILSTIYQLFDLYLIVWIFKHVVFV